LRILAVVAIFNLLLARHLALPLAGLSFAAFVICAWQYWYLKPPAEAAKAAALPAPITKNPLELGPALVFATLFIVTSVVSSRATAAFGAAGIYSLAAIVGISDIDPFVLNLAQGGTTDVTITALTAAILIAASSNNILKALYAAFFAGGKATAGSAAALVLLAVAGVVLALATAKIF
jgi:uncharacterized membrane protein (DUF4010 family)